MTIAPGLFALIVAVAGLMVGLWLGERGRRRAAENWKVFGAPDLGTGPARVTDHTGAPVDHTRRPAVPDFTEEDVSFGAANLKAQAEERGVTLTDEAAALAAREMLEHATRR